MTIVEENEVEFLIFKPDAREVFVAGDFNGWQADELSMHRDATGLWRLRVRLPSGRHRFRYFVDGQPFCDYAAAGLEPGPCGLDSILEIGAPADVLANRH